MDNQPTEKDIEAVFHRLRAVTSNKVSKKMFVVNIKILIYIHLKKSKIGCNIEEYNPTNHNITAKIM